MLEMSLLDRGLFLLYWSDALGNLGDYRSVEEKKEFVNSGLIIALATETASVQIEFPRKASASTGLTFVKFCGTSRNSSDKSLTRLPK